MSSNKKKGRGGKRNKKGGEAAPARAPSGAINIDPSQLKPAPTVITNKKPQPSSVANDSTPAPSNSAAKSPQKKQSKDTKPKSPVSKEHENVAKEKETTQPAQSRKKTKKKKNTADVSAPIDEPPKAAEDKKPEDPERAALLKFSKIERQIKASLAHIGGIRTIMELAWHVPTNSSTVTFNAVHTLQRLFTFLMEKDVLDFAPKKKSEPPAKKAKVSDNAKEQKEKKEEEGGSKKEGKEGEGKLSDAEFVQSQYGSFRKLLLHLFHHRHEKIRVLALKVLMNFIHVETVQRNTILGSCGFPESWMLKVVENLVTSELASQGEVIDSFSSNYFQKYDDVRFYTLKVLTLIMDRKRAMLNGTNQKLEERKAREGEVWTLEKMPPKLFAASCYSILQRVSMPTSKKQINSFWIPIPEAEEPKDKKSQAKDSGKSKLQQNLKRKREKEDEKKKKISGGVAVRHMIGNRKVFEDCWLAFLRHQLTVPVYKEILRHMDSHILPHMQNPVRVMDFLKDSYSIGGVISLLALHGLFVLITKHNLDYPDFYGNLYKLFQPDIFYVKYRAKFLKLATLFLTSTHLPAYLVAAFVKRMARLALTAPPAGALFAIAFVYNLLKRHPQCQVLVSRGVGTLPAVAYNPSEKTATQPVLLLSQSAETNGTSIVEEGDSKKRKKADEEEDQKSEEEKDTPKKKKSKVAEKQEKEAEGKNKRKKRKGKKKGDEEIKPQQQTEKKKEPKQKEADKKDQKEVIAKLLHEGAPGSDPFIFEEMDMAKCNAMQSSLWEIKTLQQHYLPEVSKMAHVLETFFKNNPFDLNDFVELSYQSLFETHMKRKVPEDIPLAFETVQSLFPSSTFSGMTFAKSD